jgi:AbrB family looped-hinge helix DNA binding protein
MDVDKRPATWPAKIGAQGRIVIPLEARELAGWGAGDELMVCRSESGLELMTCDQFIKQIQDHFALKFDSQRSLVDELIAERRAEAQREEGSR